jgi:hypothetical protein
MLKEVIHSTPTRHPDYCTLKKALRVTEASMARISGLILQASRFSEMESLEHRIQGARIFEGNRWLIDRYDVQRKAGLYHMIFFNDEMWVVKPSQNATLVVVERSNYSDFWLEKYAERSIAYRKGANTTSYACDRVISRAQMIDRYREISSAAQARSAAYTHTAEWVVFMEDLHLANHSMAGINQRIFVFGGLNEFHEPQNELFEIAIGATGLYTARRIDVALRPSPRYHTAMVGAGDEIYLFGGTVNGRDGLGDFWVFSGNHWTQIESSGPPPGFGLDLCFFPETGDLLLSGGLEKFVFFKYSIKDKVWEQIAADIQVPPVIGLKTFRMQSGCGFLVGGHTREGKCNNTILWFSSFGKHTKLLLCTGMPPCDRIWASFGRIGNFIFVVGGENEFQAFVLDVESQQWSLPRNSGVKNSCPSFYGAACYVENGVVWIHGGFSDTGEVQAVLYQVKVTSKEAGLQELPRMFSIQDCCKDDWTYNQLMNPASVRDEEWSVQPLRLVRRSTLTSRSRPTK